MDVSYGLQQFVYLGEMASEDFRCNTKVKRKIAIEKETSREMREEETTTKD